MILLLDNYDSFTYNLAQYLGELGCQVEVHRNDRISVEQILRALANGVPQEDLLKDYPELEPEDIRACIAYAVALVSSERVYPVGAQ